jgi:5-methylcytosine-specific restriction protein A
MPDRTRGRKLQRQRARLFREQPLCVVCLAKGRVTPATERDHIIPLSQGGTDTDDNVQALCSACHKAKSQSEMNREGLAPGCDVNGLPLDPGHPFNSVGRGA